MFGLISPLLRSTVTKQWTKVLNPAQGPIPSGFLSSLGTIPSRLQSSESKTGLITERNYRFPPSGFVPSREAWVESLETIEDKKVGLVPLHPEVFAEFPRIDVIHTNIKWQTLYKHVDYSFARTRAEMPGGGRKPWPQKKSGRARHGSIRSPLWKGGGKAKGPRGPKTYFYLFHADMRSKGLKAVLSAKLAQDDIHIVDSFESLPSEDPKFLDALTAKRNWGLSVLFVDDTDFMPKNIALACHRRPGFTLMPVYGLNCYSMLKHETLVLTLAALNKIEERILTFDRRLKIRDFRDNTRPPVKKI
ncbi:hypothetical protein RvY_17395 [Ramazzottius varieornatus]|uniref:Large ribosomal subunit protein uL4m n=1 Tax=Ramazzottius varieornatus TaxID=947166 RepID=A0A1D1W2T5_RAMVA|nr:hypothetical protein RvY_17395 [Ramazzottius varieornatus]